MARLRRLAARRWDITWVVGENGRGRKKRVECERAGQRGDVSFDRREHSEEVGFQFHRIGQLSLAQRSSRNTRLVIVLVCDGTNAKWGIALPSRGGRM